MAELTIEEKQYNKQMLALLRDIAQNTEESGGKTAETLGRGGAAGGTGSSLFELKQGTKELKTSVKQMVASADEHKKKVQETAEKNKELNQTLSKLIKNIGNANKDNPFGTLTSKQTKASLAGLSAAGIASATMMGGVSQELEALKTAAKDVDLDNMAKTLDEVAEKLEKFGDKDVDGLAKDFRKAATDLNTDILMGNVGDPKDMQDKLVKSLGDSSKTLYQKQGKDFEKVMKANMDKVAAEQMEDAEELHKYKMQTAKDFGKSLLKSVLFAAGTVTARLTGTGGGAGAGVLANYQEAGFDIGDTSTFLSLEKAAVTLGATHEDVLKFVGNHRDAISGLTQDATLTATRGAEAAERLGDEMVKSFGAGDQLGRLGTMFDILTNLGIPVEEGFDDLKNSIEIVTRNANASVTDVFAAFSTLAEDKSFRRLFAMGADQQTMVEGLTQNFLDLKESAGLTIGEFVELNKRLAAQSKEDVPERFKRAALGARLAEEVGMNPEDVSLIQRGMQNQMALRGEDAIRFPKLMADFQLAIGTATAEAASTAIEGQASYREYELQLLSNLSGVEGTVAGAIKKESNPFLGKFAEDRKKAAESQAEFILHLNTWWQELSNGFAKSIFFPGAAAVGGVVGGALGGALTVKGGLGLAAKGGAMVSEIGALGGGKLAAARVVGGAFLKLLPPIALVLGALEGLQKGFEFTGDGFEKVGAGMLGFADAILGFIPRFINLFGDIIPEGFENPFTDIKENYFDSMFDSSDERKADAAQDKARDAAFQALKDKSGDKLDITKSREFTQIMQMYKPDVMSNEMKTQQQEFMELEKMARASRDEVLAKEEADRTEADKLKLEVAERTLKTMLDQLAEMKAQYEPRVQKLLTAEAAENVNSRLPKMKSF